MYLDNFEDTLKFKIVFWKNIFAKLYFFKSLSWDTFGKDNQIVFVSKDNFGQKIQFGYFLETNFIFLRIYSFFPKYLSKYLKCIQVKDNVIFYILSCDFILPSSLRCDLANAKVQKVRISSFWIIILLFSSIASILDWTKRNDSGYKSQVYLYKKLLFKSNQLYVNMTCVRHDKSDQNYMPFYISFILITWIERQ